MLVHPNCQESGCQTQTKQQIYTAEQEAAQQDAQRRRAVVASQYEDKCKADPSAGYGACEAKDPRAGQFVGAGAAIPSRPLGTVLDSIPVGAHVVYVVPTEWVQRLNALEELSKVHAARIGATRQSFDNLKDRQARHEAVFDKKLQEMYEWGAKLEQRFAEIVTRIRQVVSTLSPI